MTSLPGREALLHEWLPRQRWFPGKGREFRVFAVNELSTLTTEPYASAIWLVDVHYSDDGSTERYQVPVVRRPQPEPTLAHVEIGALDDEIVYDALHDKTVTGAWLRHVRAEDTVGPVRFFREKGGELPGEEETSIALTGEQSNTSLVFGDAAILKVFRKLESGVNPDLELHATLTEFGSPHVAALLGGVSADLDDGEHVDLALVQRFLTTATDGWRLALASVHDLLAEGDLHPEECGGDFASEAHRLGIATAEVHDALGTALGTHELDADKRAQLISEMRGRLEVAISTASSVRPLAAAISAVYDTLAESTDPIIVQRVHGDLHLGQVVRTTEGWFVLDFEGEPARPLSQRRAPDSPLRDVAGMLRSFDYAAHRPLLEDRAGAQRLYRAREWAVRNRSAFLDGYADGAGHDPRASSVLLRAYELDKALYEVVYESRLRPDWVAIPLDAVARLSEEQAA